MSYKDWPFWAGGALIGGICGIGLIFIIPFLIVIRSNYLTEWVNHFFLIGVFVADMVESYSSNFDLAILAGLLAHILTYSLVGIIISTIIHSCIKFKRKGKRARK